LYFSREATQARGIYKGLVLKIGRSAASKAALRAGANIIKNCSRYAKTCKTLPLRSILKEIPA